MRTKSTESLRYFNYLLKTVSLALLIFFHITTKVKVAFREKYKYAKEAYSTYIPTHPERRIPNILSLFPKPHMTVYIIIFSNNCFIYT